MIHFEIYLLGVICVVQGEIKKVTIKTDYSFIY